MCAMGVHMSSITGYQCCIRLEDFLPRSEGTYVCMYVCMWQSLHAVVSSAKTSGL